MWIFFEYVKMCGAVRAVISTSRTICSPYFFYRYLHFEYRVPNIGNVVCDNAPLRGGDNCAVSHALF